MIKCPLLEKEQGYYNSALVPLPPRDIFHFCQDEKNLRMALKDMPVAIDVCLKSAEQTAPDEYEITWHNKPGSRFTGSLIFLLKKAPFGHGTIVTTEATFQKINLKRDRPSQLIHQFLKRIKELMENLTPSTTLQH